ncbi:hypothetical protein EXIGLDRAFT_770382 [Exidia glandulosa HHB12029]|uniref:Uncharacterized protein n=1 Tax=Exidia glandulosa HHB12029 TaxID=1314781 RepID=A0A165GS04_EXIGL|nr:hypothetical protein EXIGLDRAFT_770382 [Exidia glandulosa HHB12029]
MLPIAVSSPHLDVPTDLHDPLPDSVLSRLIWVRRGKYDVCCYREAPRRDLHSALIRSLPFRHLPGVSYVFARPSRSRSFNSSSSALRSNPSYLEPRIECHPYDMFKTGATARITRSTKRSKRPSTPSRRSSALPIPRPHAMLTTTQHGVNMGAVKQGGYDVLTATQDGRWRQYGNRKRASYNVVLRAPGSPHVVAYFAVVVAVPAAGGRSRVRDASVFTVGELRLGTRAAGRDAIRVVVAVAKRAPTTLMDLPAARPLVDSSSRAR